MQEILILVLLIGQVFVTIFCFVSHWIYCGADPWKILPPVYCFDTKEQNLVSVKIGLRSLDRGEQAEPEAEEPKSTENVGCGQEAEWWVHPTVIALQTSL